MDIFVYADWEHVKGPALIATQNNETNTDIINVYNWASNAWTLSTLHTPVTKAQAASANSTVMFAGLKHHEFGYHDVQIYKLASQPPITPVR